ncbi:GIY-YIG nuclease family protein [Candidatus Pelagibacter sp. Uisw_136]|uniref:GIY-YIG nuclease family protein n=1 Tax=Candidatus Pelagibacter sp. Uisw_136 TaxID=3230991 RepID=UPI0039EC9134
MNYFVYIILTFTKTKYISYVGYTNNLDKRLTLHNNSKGAKFTKGRKWTLIYKKCYKTKSLAMKNEYLLKNDRVKRNSIKKKFIKKYYENINFITI